MKHSLKITAIIILLFVMAQLIGLITINKHIEVTTTETGEVLVEYPATVMGEPLKLEESQKKFSFVYILLGVLIGTLLLLLMIRLKVSKVWKFWFLFAVVMTLAVSFGVYLDSRIAVGLALLLGIWKVYKPNPYIHNFTEIFVYTGIAIIFLPILNLISVVILLVFISIYDMIAVWQSKHMIKLAKFQTNSKVFAGLFIPYAMPKTSEAMANKQDKEEYEKFKGKAGKTNKVLVTKKIRNAVLGGGDIAFPLLFSSTVMEYLIKTSGFSKPDALGISAVITATTTLALAILLIKAEEDKFYPAMPFITLGCFLGLAIIWIGWLL